MIFTIQTWLVKFHIIPLKKLHFQLKWSKIYVCESVHKTSYIIWKRTAKNIILPLCVLSTVHGEIGSCFEQWAIKGVFLYLHKRKWIEEWRAEGRKGRHHAASERPANESGLFCFSRGDDSPLFASVVLFRRFKRFRHRRDKEGRFRSQWNNFSKEKISAEGYSHRKGVCVCRVALIIIDYVYQMSWALLLCSTINVSLRYL